MVAVQSGAHTFGDPEQLASMVLECITNSYMNAESIRIDRIPGKSTVGIQADRADRQAKNRCTPARGTGRPSLP